MEHYYFQLVLKLQIKRSQIIQKLQKCRQLQKLVTKEEWTDKRRADEEAINTLANKLDKFSDKLDNRRGRKLEKLQNPAVESDPPREIRTHNDNNKGKKPNKIREGRVHRSPPRYRNERRDEPREQRHNTHHSGKERSRRAPRNNIAPSTYPLAQATSIYLSLYYVNPIPAWPHPLCCHK